MWVLGRSQCHSDELRPHGFIRVLNWEPLPFMLYHLPPGSFLVLSPFINHSNCLADFMLQSCVQLTAISFFRSLQRSISPVDQELLEKKYTTVVGWIVNPGKNTQNLCVVLIICVLMNLLASSSTISDGGKKCCPSLCFEWRHGFPLPLPSPFFFFFAIPLLSGCLNFNPELFNMLANLENNKLFQV